MTQDEEMTPEEELETTIDESESSEALHTNYHPDAMQLGDSSRYHLTGMYQDWFLDYASYVILERAVPNIYDGLKPVQRRILHAMKCVDDGKYNKVANIVGQTMQYHPHGDASIGDALVQLGQKDLLIDCQGNWGNILTGDGAAAPRYIEARLSKFALETIYNPKTTHWMLSYDGRKKEPITLPVRFPLLLAQGVEGIAVGLNSKILPHNFCELCDAALAHLKGEPFQLYPDFVTGGSIDVSRYNDGERGGVIKIRAKISKQDQRTLIISEIPFGTTVPKVIETILRANQKGKIKVKKVEDLTAAEACIVVTLQPGVSSDKAIDALYAFTDCELSISPNCCVIQDKRPIFTSVSQLLRMSVDHTKMLLEWDLNNQKAELEEQYFYTSLEKIFIEQRIYKEEGYEKAPDKERLIQFVDGALEPFKAKLLREVQREDIERLFDIRMIRITRFDSKKADEQMRELKKKIDECKYNLAHLVEYTITWFAHLKEKYGDKYPRRTEVRNFAQINITAVVEANEKLYINRADGFIGTSLKKDEYLFDCSDMDDIILFFRDGKYKIVKVSDKAFVGANPLHVAIFKKADTRTIYNVIYRDGKGGVYYMKRFAATGLARDKEYDLTQGKAGSRIVYFSANPNGEAETVRVQLKPGQRVKKDDFQMDFSTLAIKSRSARGNLLTKFEVKSVTLKQRGASTLGGRQVWFDPDILRINYDGQGQYLGEFASDDMVLVITRTGDYYLTTFELTAHFEDNLLRIEKYDADKEWSLVMWDNEQKFYYAKRFAFDASLKPQNFLGDNPANRIICLIDSPEAAVRLVPEDDTKAAIDVLLAEFINVRTPKAKPKRLTTLPLSTILDITPEPVVDESEDESTELPAEDSVPAEDNTPTEETAPAEEPVTEPAAEPIEDTTPTTEDTPAEETPTEEAVAEEAPIEEAVAEEAPIEEVAAAPVEEAPATKPTTAVEEPTAPAEEEKPVEKPKKQPRSRKKKEAEQPSAPQPSAEEDPLAGIKFEVSSGGQLSLF